MSKHTPTPWYVGSQNDCLFIIDQPPRPSTDDIAPDQDVKVVAKLGLLSLYPESDANAEFIVRACNAHDDLAEALKEAIEVDGRRTDSRAPAVWLDRAKAALAKAGEAGE